MEKKKLSFRTFTQTVFLTGSFFVRNDLITYASACAFGFLFSILPVIIMIATILIRFLHASPDILTNLFNFEDIFAETIDIPEIINSVLSVGGSGIFEIVIGLSIFWMARRFFNSVMQGVNCIFHTEAKSQPLISQLISLAGEVLIVVAVAVLIFLFTTGQSILSSSFLTSFIPQFFVRITALLLKFIPAGLMFLFVTVSFRVASGTKPPWLLCTIASGLCTAVFVVFQLIFAAFVDMTKYNLIYGVLSNSIVLLLEVFTFFILFLFFAQYVFVFQFFDQLLLAELYLLPDRDDMNADAVIRRILFIQPDYFMRTNTTHIAYSAGTVVYREGDDTNDVYYLTCGTVQILRKNHSLYCERGAFFGELPCLLNDRRESTAVAVTDVDLIKINSETFTSMLAKNPDVSRKALAQVSVYFAKLYWKR